MDHEGIKIYDEEGPTFYLSPAKPKSLYTEDLSKIWAWLTENGLYLKKKDS